MAYVIAFPTRPFDRLNNTLFRFLKVEGRTNCFIVELAVYMKTALTCSPPIFVPSAVMVQSTGTRAAPPAWRRQAKNADLRLKYWTVPNIEMRGAVVSSVIGVKTARLGALMAPADAT
jgi:hypothetical protein